MSFIDFAFRMSPYWALGVFVFWTIWNSSYKDVLAFNKKSFFKFFLLMGLISVYRYYVIHLAVSHNVGLAQLQAVSKLPIGATLFVGWEDLCHSVPLVLLRRMLGTRKWTWPIHAIAMATVMLSFGLGHTYQGIPAAAIISLYIPFAVNFIQKKGAGTLIAGHMLYDFLTIAVIKMCM